MNNNYYLLQQIALFLQDRHTSEQDGELFWGYLNAAYKEYVLLEVNLESKTAFINFCGFTEKYGFGFSADEKYYAVYGLLASNGFEIEEA